MALNLTTATTHLAPRCEQYDPDTDVECGRPATVKVWGQAFTKRRLFFFCSAEHAELEDAKLRELYKEPAGLDRIG